MNALLVFIGGGIGSLMRYAIGIISAKYLSSGFPIATLISNSLACLILGVIMLLVIPKFEESTWIHPLFVIGICGGFSTFSTFSLETLSLFQSGNAFLGILNIFLSLGTCIGIIYLISTSSK
jgi:CrcB protein